MNEGVSVISRGCDPVITPSSSTKISNETVSLEATAAGSEIDENEDSSNETIDKMDNCHENIEQSSMNLIDVTTTIESSTIMEDTVVVKRNTTKRVCFPSNDNELVTGYLEPANPWGHAHNFNVEDLISFYKKSCEHHCTEPLINVIAQLKKINVTHTRTSELSLKHEVLDRNHCEPLEEIFKRVQFHKIDLEAASLDDESAETLFDMFEYYESARHINISSNGNIGERGWQSCAEMLKKTHCLEQLDAKDIVLTQQHFNILKRPLQLVSHLQILKLENCNLGGKAFAMLISALKLNTGLKELYLADNHLEIQDGTQLGSLLRVNHHLQLVDLSNNNLQDSGAREILAGLIVQSNDTPTGKGLSILILWNNNLTKELSGHFAEVLTQSKSLETLNIGKNAMGDEFLEICMESLKKNNYLLQLGLQSTGLMVKSVMALAEIIQYNSILERIDLRDNNIQLTPMTFLSLALKKNTTITQIDLDETVDTKSPPLLEQYTKLVREIRDYCTRNDELQSITDSSTEDSTISSPLQRSRLSSCSSRKISLTCQTLPRSPPIMATNASGVTANEVYGRTTTTIISESKRTSGGRLRSPAPSPIPSPVASPIPSPSRSRFVVSRVSEQTLLSNSNNSSTSSSPITTPLSLSHSPNCFFPNSNTNGVTTTTTTITSTTTPPTTISSTTTTNSRFRVTIVEPSTPSSVTIPVNNVITIPPLITTTTTSGTTTNVISDLKFTSDDKNKHKDMENVPPNEKIKCQDKERSSENQRHTSSLEKLLGLFQHPGNLFTSKFVDKSENKNPLHSSMSSLMGLGNKFQQYLRDGHDGIDDKTQRFTSSASELRNSIDDNSCELMNNKSLININNDQMTDTDSDINLPVNSFKNKSHVPELLVDDYSSSSIDEKCGIFLNNDNNKTSNNTLNNEVNEVNEVNEICDSSSTNRSINLSNSNSNDNISQCNIISDISNVNIVNNVIEMKIVNNVNSEIINTDHDHKNGDDNVIMDKNLSDINCKTQQDELEQQSSIELILPEKHFSHNYENNDEINCENFDDDINNILASILDMIPYEKSNECENNDEQLSNYIQSEKIVNFEEVIPKVHNINVTVMDNDKENRNDAHSEIFNDEIRSENEEKLGGSNYLKLNEDISLVTSTDTVHNTQMEKIMNENSYSLSNIESSDITIANSNSSLNSINPIDTKDLTITETETMLLKTQKSSNEICQSNGSIPNLIINNDDSPNELLENNYSSSGDVFTDEIIFNFADMTLRDGIISSDASIMFEHNSETSSNIDTFSENPSSSRDSIQESIDSGIDDILTKDKRNMDTKISINIPIINDNKYLLKDTTNETLIMEESVDKNNLPTDRIQIPEDNTTLYSDIVNSTGPK